MTELLRRVGLTAALALPLAILLTGPMPLLADGDGDCVYNPPSSQEPSCCQCNGEPGQPTNCREVYDSGGTLYCSDEVCPIDEEPCWEPGGGGN